MRLDHSKIRFARWLLCGINMTTIAGCAQKQAHETNVPAASLKLPAATPIPRASSASATNESPLAALSVTVDGKTVIMKTAHAFSRGDRAIDLVVSSATPSCSEVKASGRTIEDGEVHFEATVAPLLAKDGTETWTITHASYNATSLNGKVGQVRISGEPNTSGPIALGLKLEIDAQASDVLNVPASKLVVDGDFVAQGCGSKESDAPARPQKNLTLSVAGKPFVIQGATVKATDFPKGGHELLLATQPFDCDGLKSGSEVELNLSIGSDGKVRTADLGGIIFPAEYNTESANGSEILTLKPHGSFDAAREIEIAISGELDMAGFALKLDGSLNATRCPK